MFNMCDPEAAAQIKRARSLPRECQLIAAHMQSVRFTYMGDKRCNGSFSRWFLQVPRSTTLVRRSLRRCTGLAILRLIDVDHVDDLPCTTEMKRMRKEAACCRLTRIRCPVMMSRFTGGMVSSVHDDVELRGDDDSLVRVSAVAGAFEVRSSCRS